MQWLGYGSIEALVERRVKEAAMTNPGPMRSMSVRVPASAEARLTALSRVLQTPKSTLLRELVQTSLLQAVDALEKMFEGDEEFAQNFSNEVERYEHALVEGREPVVHDQDGEDA